MPSQRTYQLVTVRVACTTPSTSTADPVVEKPPSMFCVLSVNFSWGEPRPWLWSIVVTPSCRFQSFPDGPGTLGSAEVTSAPRSASCLIWGRMAVVPCCATLLMAGFQAA
jgi:hypothetical protein